MFRTGELATKANISRRTLHYYDEIGLLKPTKVDDKHYRYYDYSSLLQLQEIRLLKSIGFTLQQIKQIVRKTTGDSDGKMWVQSLQKQIKLIQKEKEELERKQYYLQTTVHAIQVTGQINAGEIFELIQSLEDRKMENGVIPATFPDQLFTDDEQKTLEQLPVFGSNDPRLVKIIECIEAIQRNRHKSPSDKMMQEFAKGLDLQMISLFQGNTGLMEKYWSLIKPKENQPPIIYGLDHELFRYIDKMFEFYYQQQE
ncbi:MerR family transcriptional regulator [Shimazuella kribbensis]|uniref:MerR family transcriptional regulator n=1 Tax=Shimazuella kribbensis TaxID=139808 RepID=UPI000406DF24|nr:MerR family transcriptional regulator [Shimazuella kribbensis]